MKWSDILKTAKVDLLSKDQLEDIVKSSRTLQEVLKKVGYSSVSGANRKTVQKRIDKYQISTNHFTKGVGIGTWYFKGKYAKYKCSICGPLPEWQGKELSLTLDHINGNNTDDRIENLRWICPNCDRQLDTFGSKNKRKF